MDLTSPNFEEGGRIPREHTCDGDDAPPELLWSGVPSGVVELALTCEDPDAPGGTFVHWVVWGIDPSSGRIGVDDGPGIRHGRNGFGTSGYGGPCPPPGHGSTIEQLRSAIDGHVRATATLMGTYER
jgi:Raf kinase inhibitor-like YbhB/YbcL family protein